MSARVRIATYLVRDSLVRWRGRASLPLARLAISLCLGTAALLVLASFALAARELQRRIAGFGLDTMVIRTAQDHATDPAPAWNELGAFGPVLTLKLAYARPRLETGGTAALAFAVPGTRRALGQLAVPAAALPVLLSDSLPPGMPVRASLGAWSVTAVTAPRPPGLQALGPGEVLIADVADFPALARSPVAAVTALVRRSSAPPLEELDPAVRAVVSANPAAGTAPEVQSSLALLRELQALQARSVRYAAFIVGILALMIAAVFASGAILEYQATEYTTALLRSLGVRRRVLWLQRAAEAVLTANLGAVAAIAAARGVAAIWLPDLIHPMVEPAVWLPVIAALNGGAILACGPVALALRRPVGLVLP